MKLLLTAILLLAAASNVQAQRVISGTVTSVDDGNPLPGVNVSIQGTQIGTVTDFNGEYEITIESADQVLIFSMVGFQRYDTEVGTRSIINVELQMATEMFDELIVTAFGMEREARSLGYSTQSINSQVLSEARDMNVLSNLRGRISGVEISQSPVAGGSAGILIRGVGSITGNNMPLIVVDGIPIDNQQLQEPGVGSGGIDYGDGIGGVRPDDIENLTVLKGPNASALYGARASNGVIVITTKSGRDRQGIGVDYSSNVTFDQIGMKPQFQNKYGAGYGFTFEDAWGWNRTTFNGTEYFEFGGVSDHHGPPLDDRLILIQNLPELGPVSATPQPSDNIFDFFETGITANNSVAVSGGSESTTYRLSFSDQRNKGVVPNSQFSSNSVALRITTDVSERISVDGRVNYYRHQGTNRPHLGESEKNVFFSLANQPRFIDLEWLKDFKNPDGSIRNSVTRYPSNPYWMVNERVNDDQRDRVYGFISAKYDFTEWLSLNVRAGTDTYHDQRFQRAPIGDPSDQFGRVENRSFVVQENNYDFLLSTIGNISQDFSGSFMFGGNYLNTNTEQTGMDGSNLSIPGLYHISNANSLNPIFTQSKKEMHSLYSLGQIGYRDYLYLDLSARNDWSSTLGLGNESFFYPSASLSFVVSDAFDIGSSVLTFAKLRASYAETGNDASPYLTKAGYNISSVDYNGVRMATVPGQIPLIDLKNELTKSWEFGADIRLFNNRLSIDVTTYNASTENQIFGVPVSNATGYSTKLINAGQIDNSGVEFSVNGRIIETQDFMWNLGINASQNRSKVVELAPGVGTHILASSANVLLQASPGEPYGNLYSFVPMRTEDGRLLLSANGGLQVAPEREVVGNMQPDFVGGIVNDLYYKGFSLGAVIDYRLGGDIASSTMNQGFRKGTGIHTQERSAEMFFDGVIENSDGSFRENDQPVDPVTFYPGRAWSSMGSFWIVDGTYVSLTELTLGYNFSPSLLANTPLTSLKVSVVGRNLGFLFMDDDLRKMGVPPNSSNSRQPGALAYEQNNFPLLRTIGFNVNVQF